MDLLADRDKIKKSKLCTLLENETWGSVSRVKGQLEIGLDEESIDEILDYVCSN